MFPINAIYQSSDDGTPLGTRSDLTRRLAELNTTPDRTGGMILYGPGIIVSLHPEESDEVMTVLVDETGHVERELAQLSLDRIERVFPDWTRKDSPSDEMASEDTEEFFEIDEFLDD